MGPARTASPMLVEKCEHFRCARLLCLRHCSTSALALAPPAWLRFADGRVFEEGDGSGCKRLGVLAEKTMGYRDLVSDFDTRIQWDGRRYREKSRVAFRWSAIDVLRQRLTLLR
jgi:hypothetical protein